MTLESKIPAGDIATKWTQYKSTVPLVNPANKRQLEIIVVGTGLAGASAAATLAEMGYKVKAFCFQDSPRRAHSIAAQGGINAAKNYQNDGDSVYRLFYDTIKGGDYRAREANVHRLAECSTSIIDQCVAQGVPFAREYGGTLSNRSFGGTQVQRTFYAAGQTESSPGIWLPANWKDISVTPYCCAPVVTETYSTCLPMPWAVTLPPRGKPTKQVLTLVTLASPKSTQLVSPYPDTISQN